MDAGDIVIGTKGIQSSCPLLKTKQTQVGNLPLAKTTVVISLNLPTDIVLVRRWRFPFLLKF